MRRRLAILSLLLALPAAAIEVATREPRAFGVRIGDVVERRVVVHAPAALPDKALPKPGRLAQGLELRAVEVERRTAGDGIRHEILLRYQWFGAPPGPQALVLPALRLAGADGAAIELPEYRLYVAPLVPADFAGDSVLGLQRPDVAPPPIDDRAVRLRLAGFAATAVLLALWLLWRQFGDRLLPQRRRPFAAALRQLDALDPASADDCRRGVRLLHRAFDQCHGATLFAAGVADFVAAHPEFAPQREAIEAFFAASKRRFFAGDTSCGLEPVLALCRACRLIERDGR